MTKVSIIVPVYNEETIIEEHISSLVKSIYAENNVAEIIYVDGWSTDLTQWIIQQWKDMHTKSFPIHLLHAKKWRGAQLNRWASVATWEVLFFVFADCMPGYWFDNTIITSYKSWKKWGVCTFSLSPGTRRIKLFEPIYNLSMFYRWRFWDSWIIVDAKLFKNLWMVDESLLIEEDHELIMRLKKSKNFFVFPVSIVVSDRLFKKNGYIKTFLLYSVIHILYLCKAPEMWIFYLLRKLKWQKSLS
jgi:glycosyltransferase involved in cell wall biosynthesis